MITPADVWAALAGVPDPELPVVSLVDLGVVSSVHVEGERVSVRITATFLGCPALDEMGRRTAAAIAALGGQPEVEIARDDAWSTDRVTPEGREKLRRAGLAPPAARAAGGPTLLELRCRRFRCPYCGSTDTALENMFGPTPCRSLRYCRGCRQPFEQLKTI